MPPSDLPSALLNLVRVGPQEDGAQALDPRDTLATRLAPPVVDHRALAHTLGASIATVDRLCRRGLSPTPSGASWVPTKRATYEAAKPTLTRSTLPAHDDCSHGRAAQTGSPRRS
jgi:hypothetical protein